MVILKVLSFLLRKFVISYRFLFNKNHLSKEWDVFGCFTVPDFEPNELFPMDPSGMKKYTEEDEDGSAGAAAAAATAAAKVTIGKKIGACSGPCNPSKWEADI